MSDFDHVAAVRVGRHYERRRALHGLSFTARSGDIVGLLGPNGAGKSTLLAILGTLLAASTGHVEYGATRAADAGSALRARIGMLGHDLFLYPELSARENLVFFASLYGLERPGAVADAALERAGLSARGGDLVSSFSRGMRQRVALERALLHGPRLLLLDEPFTGLDQASAAALVTRLRDEQARGVITLLATHDLDVVDGVLTDVLFLQGGRRVSGDAGGVTLRERYHAAMQDGPRS
ncbi:MAG: ABC transporter ATP-binding protein [Candidatus Binatia bacterium]